MLITKIIVISLEHRPFSRYLKKTGIPDFSYDMLSFDSPCTIRFFRMSWYLSGIYTKTCLRTCIWENNVKKWKLTELYALEHENRGISLYIFSTLSMCVFGVMNTCPQTFQYIGGKVMWFWIWEYICLHWDIIFWKNGKKTKQEFTYNKDGIRVLAGK